MSIVINTTNTYIYFGLLYAFLLTFDTYQFILDPTALLDFVVFAMYYILQYVAIGQFIDVYVPYKLQNMCHNVFMAIITMPLLRILYRNMMYYIF